MLYPFLLAFARSRFCKSKADAEDLAQETVLKALRAEHLFDGRNAKAWMFTIMRNIRLSQLRHGSLVGFVSLSGEDAGGEDMTFDVSTPGHQADSIDLDDGLRAMASLPLEMIDSLVLVARGHSYEATAERVGSPVGTVKSRVARGRAKLKELTK